MFYIGMDVAKAKLDCCLLLDDASGKRKTKTVGNNKSGIADLLAWVVKQHVSPEELHVVMDATGVYHEQAAMALADAGVIVSIVNPAQVKDFGRGLAVRTKTDGVDSFVLARYGALLKPAASGYRLPRKHGCCKLYWRGAMPLPKTCNASAIARRKPMPPTLQS